MSVMVVAECGSNWWGDPDESQAERLDRAVRLIRTAAKCGADAAKFQAFRADDLYPKDSEHWHTVKPLELPLEWLPTLAAIASERGIDFMASCFSEEMVDAVDPYVKRHKVASLEITDMSLLRRIASKGRPVIMSTGAATDEQVARATHALANEHQVQFLHCITAYPCPPEDTSVRLILRKSLDWYAPVGLSDHTLDPVVAPVMAVALGATMIEKHLTLSRSLAGPDHAYALEPGEFAEMVRCIRLAEKMLGDGIKRVQPSEEAWRRWQHQDRGLRGGIHEVAQSSSV